MIRVRDDPGEVPPPPAYLHSEVQTEDEEADYLEALSEAAGGLPGGGAEPGVRGDGQGGGPLHKRQQQQHRNGEAQEPGDVGIVEMM